MARSKSSRTRSSASDQRYTEKVKLDAIPDSLDFRDLMFVPTLIEVPPVRSLEAYKAVANPILDQGSEGACTGFGLAAVANYLMRSLYPPSEPLVSPRMLYEMAKRYDEWPGEAYDGSSARGAMKGWHKHGVCSETVWPYAPQGSGGGRLTPTRSDDALRRPLGAYFRVNHKDLVAMHCALTEVGILYATASVHEGWNTVPESGELVYSPKPIGGHAFAIVAYDTDGFWIQNSWGPGWGANGFAKISYDDWLTNGFDVWVARLGVPVKVNRSLRSYAGPGAVSTISTPISFEELRPHVVLLGNDGLLKPDGMFGNDVQTLTEIVDTHIPEITKGWKRRRILLYSHGGLVSENSALERISDYRKPLLDNEIYPISIVWRSGLWETLENVLREAISRRKSEGWLDAAKDFMLDRLDDALEPIARQFMGKTLWQEMKENALLATTNRSGGARLLATRLATLAAKDSSVEFHCAGHSAGSILLGPLTQLLTGADSNGTNGLAQSIQTLTLWAPACTTELFKTYYQQQIKSKAIRKFKLVNLTDRAECDDHCAHLYNKSLLYLVSHAFEQTPRIPWIPSKPGTPLLGLDKIVNPRSTDRTADPEIQKFLSSAANCTYATAPNDRPIGEETASRAMRHGDFDDDEATVKGLLATILGLKNPREAEAIRVRFPRTSAGQVAQRRVLQTELQRV